MIIPLTLLVVIAAAWTLRWAIESRDVSLEEILAFKGVHIKSEEITAFHLATTIYGGIKSSITIKPGDLQFNQYLELWSKQQYKMLKYESEDNPLLDTEDADFLSPARIQVDAVVNEKKICCIISIFPDPKEHIIYFMSEKDYVYQYPEDCELLNPNYIEYLIGRKKGPDYPRIYDYALVSPYLRLD